MRNNAATKRKAIPAKIRVKMGLMGPKLGELTRHHAKNPSIPIDILAAADVYDEAQALIKGIDEDQLNSTDAAYFRSFVKFLEKKRALIENAHRLTEEGLLEPYADFHARQTLAEDHLRKAEAKVLRAMSKLAKQRDSKPYKREFKRAEQEFRDDLNEVKEQIREGKLALSPKIKSTLDFSRVALHKTSKSR